MRKRGTPIPIEKSPIFCVIRMIKVEIHMWITSNFFLNFIHKNEEGIDNYNIPKYRETIMKFK